MIRAGLLRSVSLSLLLLTSVAAVACGDDTGTTADPSGSGSGTGASTGTSSDGGGGGGAAGSGGAGGIQTTSTGAAGGEQCVPPDLLIALDRTLTMHRMPDGSTPTDAPDYASSKWSQAITALEGLVTPELDDTIRFGLELWPREEPGCITLTERVTGTVAATNPYCSDGEVLLSPALGASTAISDALDPLTTKICISTPTAAGISTGAEHLATIAEPGRDQYMMLVTDGADWDQSCPTPDPVAVTQQLAADGIKTFILGFSATGDIQQGGVGAPFLNNMACAGRTAPDFDTNCTMGPAGYTATDPAGPTLYLQASDGDALSAALDTIAATICCDCVE
jgi:hypothetical protein